VRPSAKTNADRTTIRFDRSLRIAFVPVTLVFVIIVFLVVLFFIWLLSEEGAGRVRATGERAIKGVSAKILWIFSRHAQCYASPHSATKRPSDCYNSYWGGYVLLLFQVL